MLSGLEYVKETISIRGNDILSNPFETNNLLLEDILLALGYNKRREPGVKAMYAGGAEWEISSNGNKHFLVAVYGYGDKEVDSDKLAEAVSTAEDQQFPLVVATNGMQLSVYTNLGDLIYKVSDIFSDDSAELIEILSNDKFDINTIMAHKQEAKLTTDELNKILTSDNILDAISSEQENPVKREVLVGAIQSLFVKGSQITEEQLEAEKSRVAELEAGIGAEKAKVAQLEASKVNLESHIVELENQITSQANSQTEDTGLKQQIEDLEGQILSSNKKINSLETELSETKSKITELESQLAAKDETIAQLNSELEQERNKEAEPVDNSQIVELQAQIEKLTQEKEQLDSEYEQFKNSTSSDALKAAGLESKVQDLTTKLDNSREEVERLTNELNLANTKVSELESRPAETVEPIVDTAAIEALQSQITQLSQEINVYKSQINDLNGQLAESTAEVTRLREAQQTNTELTSDDSNADTDSYRTQIAHLQQSLDEARAENDKLKAEKTDFSQGNKFETEAAYRQRIADLIDENQKRLLELNNTKEKLAEMERKASGAEDEKVAMAKQLLEAVEDNAELRRTYVGVVESKLFQVMELNKFIGTCLQELFNAVEYDLMPILFDGDMFKIVKPAVRKDLLISTNAYDLDLSGIDEVEALSKLKKVFNNFPKVVFMCKTIGTLEEGHEVGLGAGAVLNAPQFNSSIPIDGMDNFDEVIDLSPDADNNPNPTSDMGSFVDGVSADGVDIDNSNGNSSEYIEEPPVDNGIKLIGFALSDVQPVLISPENPIINLEAIGNPLFCFRIRNQTFYDILNDGIIAVLSMTNRATDSLLVLKNSDLATLGLSVTTEPISDASVQILNTGYFIEVHSVSECVRALLVITDLIPVDKTQIYIYFSSEYNPDSSFQNNYLEVSQINVNKFLDINDYEPSKDTIHCLLEGKVLDLIDTIPGVYETASNLFTAVLAVKNTNKIQRIIKSYNDIALTIQDLLSANPNIDVGEMIGIINNSIQFNGNLISTNVDVMQGEYSSFEVNGVTYYMNNIQGFPVVLILYYLNSMVYNNESSLDLRIQLNSTLYTIYKNGVDISDCEEYLASKLILELIEGKTKVIVPKK